MGSKRISRRGFIRRVLKLGLSASAVTAFLEACASESPTPRTTDVPEASATPQTTETPALPPPRQVGPVSLEAALARRRSLRRFSARTLSDQEISQLLWATQGITSGEGFRTAPSAGALYPLEIYIALAEGLFHYRPQGHRLEMESREDLRGALCGAALGQIWVKEAPLVMVIAADYQRTASKYGDRAERYVILEAGHAAQNVLLQAVALGLGGVPVGAFYDEAVQKILGLPPELTPLYLIPLGYPPE